MPERASGVALSAAGFLLDGTSMATLGGMTFPRLVDHPQAAAKLRDGMVEAIDSLAIEERDDGTVGAPGGHPVPSDAEIHAFASEVVAKALPDVLRLLDETVANVVLDDAPEIADH